MQAQTKPASKASSLASPVFKRLVKQSLFERPAARGLILFLSLISAVGGLASPFFQKIFVDRLMHQNTFAGHDMNFFFSWLEGSEPMLLIVLAFFAALAAQAFGLLANYAGVREGLIIQESLAKELYEKTLSTRTDEMGSTTVGEVVSLYATDIPGSSALVDQVIPMLASIAFPMIFAPIAIHWICGIPMTVTVSVMAAMILVNVVLASRQSRFFYRFKTLAAERTGIVNEWVQNIRLLRILGWVEDYEEKIFRKRREETSNRVAMVTNGQLMNSFGSSITYVLNLTGVAALVYLRDKPVTAGELFALLWILGVFLTRPFRQTPWIFTFVLDSISSLRRVAGFLEKRSSAGGFPKDEILPEAHAALPIHVRGLTLKFGDQERLSDIDLDIQAGEFVAVVGEVGSGKSLLVLSLMGETGASFREFKIGSTDALRLDLNERRRSFAFVSQEGFVMSASLRENIAFRYEVPAAVDREILHSLELAQFSLQGESVRDGLDTEIGERGVNLSGGQRQRVSLARAHNFDRPLVLLDDCLSAVDVDTETKLVDELIAGAWKNKTRVLVTHRLSVLARVDRVLFMKDGRILDSGRFTDLLQRSPEMRDFVASVRRGEASGETLKDSTQEGGTDVTGVEANDQPESLPE